MDIRRIPLLRTAALFSVLALSACHGCGSNEGSALVRMSPRQRAQVILTYPPERQVELYLEVMFKQHPPDLGLGDALASNGSSIVPALTSRLLSDEREAAKTDLIYAFTVMQLDGHYAVRDDKDLMEILRDQIASMHNPIRKNMSTDMLQRILAQQEGVRGGGHRCDTTSAERPAALPLQ